MAVYQLQHEINTIHGISDRGILTLNADSEPKAKQTALSQLIKKYPNTNPQFVTTTIIEE